MKDASDEKADLGRNAAVRVGDWRGIRVYTIGHSTRSLDELQEVVKTFDVSVLVDIRTIPRSHHNPQFDGTSLRSRRGLRYVHIPELGGLRRPRKDSVNTGWRNMSFRGYADYMMTEDFEVGLAKLRALIHKGATVALMCAEAVPWRCHRSLVADALTARGSSVEDIIGRRSTPHRMTPFAVVNNGRLTYPGPLHFAHAGE